MIRRGIIDHTDSWEITQQLRDATDVLRIAMGKYQPRQSVHAGPVQIRAHDSLVTAFAPAIDQPVVAIYLDVNCRASAQIQHHYLRRDLAAPVRLTNIKMSARNSREQMYDADDQRC